MNAHMMGLLIFVFSKMGFVILIDESNGRTTSKSWLLDHRVVGLVRRL